MGIYIKGMEMPQSCYDCSFQHPCKHDEDKDYCVVIDDFLYCYNMEANNCPLIEVPPHGRLIDADDIENITVIMNKNGVGFNRIVAPTVIPADKDGEI